MKRALLAIALVLAGCGYQRLETDAVAEDEDRACSCATTDYYASRWQECEASRERIIQEAQ